MLRIDVRHERDRQAGIGEIARERRERIADEPRPEIGAADADVDDVRERFAARAAAPSRPHVVDERAHSVLRGANERDHVGAVDDERGVVLLAQRRVQCRAALGQVDLLAGEKSGDPAW